MPVAAGSRVRQVFLPTTRAQLSAWCANGAAASDSALVGFAVTGEFAAEFGRDSAAVDHDDDELLLEALTDAAASSAERSREAGEPGAVTVLAVEAEVIEQPGAGAQVRVEAPVPRARWVAAYRAPTSASGTRPDASDLAWYAVQELPAALE